MPLAEYREQLADHDAAVVVGGGAGIEHCAGAGFSAIGLRQRRCAAMLSASAPRAGDRCLFVQQAPEVRAPASSGADLLGGAMAAACCWHAPGSTCSSWRSTPTFFATSRRHRPPLDPRAAPSARPRGALLVQIPHSEVANINFQTSSGQSIGFSFSRAKIYYPFVAFVRSGTFSPSSPRRATRYPGFHLVMQAEALDLIQEDGVVRGVRYRTPDGEHEQRALLTISADGRARPRAIWPSCR